MSIHSIESNDLGSDFTDIHSTWKSTVRYNDSATYVFNTLISD